MNKIKDLWQSQVFKLVAAFLILLIIILLAYQAGRFVGFRQASFSYRLGDNYYRAFERPRGPGEMMRQLPFGDLPGGHGAVGKIVKINLPTVIISTPDNLEKTILVNPDTAIKRFRGVATATDLRVGDMLVIVGQPDQESKISAKLIRLLPPPFEGTTTDKK